jgi:imidazolonepropionase-like amidohydrolase
LAEVEPSYPVITQNTLIAGAIALVGEELIVQKDASVLVSDGRIAAVGNAAEVDGGGADVLRATGMSLIPGFVDAHVHIGFVEPARVLRGGVTTVRDLAWPPDVIFPLAHRSREPDFDGPTIAAAGPMLTAPRGYPTRASWAPMGTGLEIADADAGRAAVKETAARGAAIIKVALEPRVGPVIAPDVLAAIVDEAHETGLKVTGHVGGLDQLDVALDAGMDELAHMLMSRERIPEETIARMADAGMVIVPTLSVRSGRDLDVAVDNLRRFIAAGGRVVYGTDLGNAGPKPGIDAREIDGLSRAGMSPLAIVAAATTDAARHLDLDVGVIEVGRRADLVLLEGDVTTDAAALTRVVQVWRYGRAVL